LAAVEGISKTPSAPTAMQRPVIAARLGTVVVCVARSSAGGGEDRVAKRALGDCRSGRARELEGFLYADLGSLGPSEPHEARSAKAIVDPLRERRRVLVARLDLGHSKPCAGDLLHVALMRERPAEAGDGRE